MPTEITKTSSSRNRRAVPKVRHSTSHQRSAFAAAWKSDAASVLWPMPSGDRIEKNTDLQSNPLNMPQREPSMQAAERPDFIERLAADLAAHLKALRLARPRARVRQIIQEFLEPYNLSPDDECTVTILAEGKQCIDCGDVRDYYVVYDHVWKAARLKPNQCCCRKCLSVRLGRPLERGDLTLCPVNMWKCASNSPATGE